MLSYWLVGNTEALKGNSEALKYDVARARERGVKGDSKVLTGDGMP